MVKQLPLAKHVNHRFKAGAGRGATCRQRLSAHHTPPCLVSQLHVLLRGSCAGGPAERLRTGVAVLPRQGELAPQRQHLVVQLRMLMDLQDPVLLG